VRNTLIAAMLVAAAAAQAQQAASAPPVSAAKKALVAKVIQLQQQGIEGIARQLAEQPALQMLQQAGVAMQRVPADKREALAKELQADARRYAEETIPVVRERALRLAPTTIGAVLEQKMTDDELKQLVVLLESPVNRKYSSLLGDMQRALGEKLVAETRPDIDPKVRALEQTMARKINAAIGSASAPASGAKN
jgi:predicted Fe-Mo cluster-binding NifX family protein